MPIPTTEPDLTPEKRFRKIAKVALAVVGLILNLAATASRIQIS